MPRRPRWFQSQVPVHVLQRGVNRASCFHAPEDYRAYKHWLEECARHHRCAIHAYVLMTNHVHLLLSPADASAPSALMQDLGRSYVRYFNRKYERTGTLWEGRFKAHPVQAEDYLLTVHRYIELNPVRARMVGTPWSYPWSSSRANASGVGDSLLTPHGVYSALSLDRSEPHSAYKELFYVDLDAATIERIRQCTAKGLPFGDEQFGTSMAQSLGLSLGGRRGRPPRKNAHEDISTLTPISI